MAAPPDAGRKSRTLYDPGPAKPEASPSDVFANPTPPRAAFDPQDPFKSSIVSDAPPAPTARPKPSVPQRQATMLQGPAPEAKDISGVLCVHENGRVRLVALPAGRTGLGRDASADICLDDANVSGSHAFIYMRESGCSFIDVSRNGSIVDGTPLMGEDAVLTHGSVIELGQTRCVLLVVPPESRTS